MTDQEINDAVYELANHSAGMTTNRDDLCAIVFGLTAHFVTIYAMTSESAHQVLAEILSQRDQEADQ